MSNIKFRHSSNHSS